MPQSIFVQVGQCGNQIGYCFWDLALQEYRHQKNVSAEDISNFFKPSLQSASTSNALDGVKARAIMVDMEEGVISETFRRPLKDIFDKKQLLTDVSGSGNNWAVGNKFYGSKYHDQLIELFRKEAEECDCLQCFFLLHSMGGGTGSGVGTAALQYLYEEFRKIPRFVFTVFPSLHDDVIISPYNTVLANSQLIKFADCVFPFENKALTEICNRLFKVKNPYQFFDQNKGRLKSGHASSSKKSLNVKESKPFDEMNAIIANCILNLTCSSRFPGTLNVDLNEIIVNMTPFRRLHYLVPSASPLYSCNNGCKIDQMFSDVFSDSHQLFQSPIKQGTLLACALLCRGQICMSDVQHNIDRLKGNLKFVPWNEEGWKIGLCKVPHIEYPHSVLMLANTSSIAHPLSYLKESFLKMYRKKAHLHHFLEVECMEKDVFKSSISDLEFLIEEYKRMETINPSLEKPRLSVLV